MTVSYKGVTRERPYKASRKDTFAVETAQEGGENFRFGGRHAAMCKGTKEFGAQ